MSEALLRVTGLVKRFGGVAANDGVELEVRAGEVHALIGPNGAGKSTLVNQLSGALAPDAGRISFEGRDITRLPMHRRVAAGLARSYQVTSVFPRFAVRDNVALAVQARRGAAVEVDEVLRTVGLESRARDLAGALSHGEQRRLEVALVLATRARLLLLDEPMAGMDRAESARLVDLLQSLRSSVTVLLVEHDMDAVFRLADRISVLVDGRVVATGSLAEIRANDAVRRAYLGEGAPA
jgi:branched-chain amino acid transport system ATP-binding protein